MMLQNRLLASVKRPAASICAKPITDWLNIARRICSWRPNLISARLRVATCALTARLTTEMLIMNTTSSKNPSSELAGANGPLPASAPQTAKQERISTAVAVSRSPQRSAVHNSGNTAKNASALLTALSSKSGLNATSPTRLVTMMPTIEDSTLSESKPR